VEHGHPHGPKQIRKAFNGRFARIPDETMPGGQISRVPHRNHGVVEEREVPDVADRKRGAEDEDRVKSRRCHQHRGSDTIHRIQSERRRDRSNK
jgi:hypothetical protein